jgi:uncharacterized membrane protein
MKYWGIVFVLMVIAGFAGFQWRLWQIPVAAMAKTEKRIANVAGGYNTMYHAKRPDGDYRGVVRPSPDQLYSACVYDLSAGPVVFEGTAPANSYWSLSFFQHNTDNFFVINDRQIGGQSYRFVLVQAGQDVGKKFVNEKIIRSPSSTGIVLQRVFISSDETAQELDAQRTLSTCAVATKLEG